MENKVVRRGRANVAQYENGDVDVRWPEEHEELKLQKVSETRAGSLTKTQGKEPLLQLVVKTRADAADPAADLSEECTKLLRSLCKNDSKQLKIGSKSKGRWLCYDENTKIRADTERGKIVVLFDVPLVGNQSLEDRINTKNAQIT